MSELEIDLLDFARRWAPYGGGSVEDIFVTFGWSATKFFERLEDLVTHKFLPIDDSLRHRLLDICAHRLQRRPDGIPMSVRRAA
nr:DUF3263 domain-containing protein [Rhodococcus wratislaviensis]GLK33777.1 hypothetical protein GCM10017611_06200 [Rhodococcus wratislaviensis]